MMAPYTPVANFADKGLLIHGNYSAHTSPVIYETVREMGHHVVCRPPYGPQDKPVEFAINQVINTLELR